MAEGDSITSNPSGYAALYSASASPALLGYNNLAVSSSTMNELNNRAATVDAAYVSGAFNVLSVMMGNDLVTGEAAPFTASLATYLDARKQTGWIIVLCTTLPRSAAAAGASFNTRRATANATFRTWVGVHCDHLIDFDLSDMGDDADASDTNKYTDGVHPSNAGQIILHDYFRPIMDAVVGGRVWAPVLSHSTGTQYNNFTLTATAIPSGATLRYTVDGSEPTASSTALGAGASINGTLTTAGQVTAKVKAFASGLSDSSTTSATYTLQVAAPNLVPGAGEITAQNVAMSDTTTGATIYYTNDGTTPTTSSTQYSSPIYVDAPITLKAIAAKSGYLNSSVTTAAYTIAASGPPTANRAAWYKKNTGITNSSGVTAWADQSGYSRDLLNASGSGKPTLNGDGTISFDGVDDWLKTAGFTLAQPITFGIVFKYGSNASGDRLWDGNSVNTMGVYYDGNHYMYAGNDKNVQSVMPAANTWAAMVFVYNGANSYARAYGGSPTASSNAGAASPGGFILGAGVPGALCANITVAEVVIYSAAPGGSTENDILTYLESVRAAL